MFLPTREGAAVLAVAGAIFLLATNLMSGLLFVLDALLVSLLAVGGLTVLQPLSGLRVDGRSAVRATEGEPYAHVVRLRSDRGARFVVVEDGWPGARARVALPYLAPGATAETVMTLVPSRRGLFTLGPVEVVVRGPVGLATGRRRLRAPAPVVVRPAVRPVSPAVLERLLPALDGRAAARRVRDPADLYGVRDYQSGDHPGRIHWRSSARRGALVVREFEQPAAPAAAVLADLDARQSPARLEAVIRAAASILRLAGNRGLEVALLGWDGDLMELHGWEAGLDWLAAAQAGAPPLAAQLARLAPGRVVVVVAATADLPPLPEGALAVTPCEDADRGPVAAGLVYEVDGTVRAW